MKHRIITIDGPAGSGKSTVAREVARRLGFTYLDTGALYRAAALAVISSGVEARDGVACASVIDKAEISLHEDKVYLDGRDVSSDIRSPGVAEAASAIAVHADVRKRLTALQRELADRESIVAEGRDTGSVVFPGADLKIFLDADIAERARRRHAEFARKGMDADPSEVFESMRRRDEQDGSRRHSPLRVPENAFVVDTTHLTQEEVVVKILSMVRQALAD
ncbi:MAG TPA: (d)CMP kinase [Deltaproteobacteria bacterium]|nr:(d)CMP kinase [Deltaproteobacteria bacterium]